MDDQNQESFVNDLQSVNFQIALEVFKKQQIQLPDKKDYQDLFLTEQIFPVLLEGLERLSREVEKYLQDKDSIDIEVRKRFNPCIFLAQFLMRNNPKHHPEKNEQVQFKQILQYVRKERFNRFFQDKKSVFLKNMMKATKIEKPECDLQEVRVFIKDLDERTNQKGKLNDYFLNNKTINKMKKNIHFEVILQEIIKYCAGQKEVVTDDFVAYLT